MMKDKTTLSNDCKKVRLFHQTSWESIPAILEHGLYATLDGCGESDPYPPRRLAVYGSDELEIRRIARRSEEGMITDYEGKSLDDSPVIEFEVCTDEVMVGDIHAECQPRYLDTLMPYDEFFELTGGGRGFRGRWQEAEFFIPDEEYVPPVSGTRSPHPRILPSQIKAVHRMKDLVEPRR